MTIFWIVLAVLILWLVFTYNRFISLKNRVKEAWADIDVQLKRRYDLIPNLVETVKGYTAHESTAFEKVTEARAKALGAIGPEAKAAAEGELSSALKSIIAIAEAYPDLKASTNFGKLQDELADTENKIQAARRFYNGNVRDWNILVATFPANLLSKSFSFDPEAFFELEAGSVERELVAVKF